MHSRGFERFVLNGHNPGKLAIKNGQFCLQLQPPQVWKTTIKTGEYIEVKNGRCWITVTGFSDDIILYPGQCWKAPNRVEVVLSALCDQPCTFEVKS